MPERTVIWPQLVQAGASDCAPPDMSNTGFSLIDRIGSVFFMVSGAVERIEFCCGVGWWIISLFGLFWLSTCTRSVR